MRIRSVESYGSPAYPTKSVYVKNPHLLDSYVPDAWKVKRLAAGTVAALMLGSCEVADEDASTESSGGKSATTEPGGRGQAKTQVSAQERSAKVAPLFLHGDGRGAEGCVVITPPVFISERDALEIITEMLAAEGITFAIEDKTVDDIEIEQRRPPWLEHRDKTSVKMKVDCYDPDHNLAIEFVSQQTYYRDSGGQPYVVSTVRNYDFKGLAADLRSRLVAYGGMNAAVFYDPCPDMGEPASLGGTGYKAREQAREEAEVDLRKQVSDFIRWLRDEEVLPPAETKR